MDDRQLLDSRESPSEEAIARIDREFREGFALLDAARLHNVYVMRVRPYRRPMEEGTEGIVGIR